VIANDNQTSDEPARSITLRLRDVSYYGGSENSIRLAGANLVVRQTELITLRIDPAINTRSMASLLQGLAEPFKGDVLFEETPWRGASYDEHFAMRSRIGRVFDGQAWIQNLDIAENLTLAYRHHRKSPESLDKDLAHWVDVFGIGKLSRLRPAFMPPSLLQMHQWVRAFIGSPKLLILERPMNALSPTVLPKLIDAVNEIRGRGAAVLWFTSDPTVIGHPFAGAHMQYELQNQKPVQVAPGVET
jgi:phospholipid/cholesterol/gamma-HCH transport system ATP-binding protein